jgi:ATP-dependent protease ClpP protease subunit
MYHGAHGGHGGDLFEQQAGLKEFARQAQQYDRLVATETWCPIEDIKALYADKRLDRYLTPQRAIQMGFADKLTSAIRR